MSIGMNVQCSVMEGHVRGGLLESPMRALNGNQITQQVQYQQGSFGYTPFAGPYAATWGSPTNAGSNACIAGSPYATPTLFFTAESIGAAGGLASAFSAGVAALPTPVWGVAPMATTGSISGGGKTLSPYPENTGYIASLLEGQGSAQLFQALSKNTTLLTLPYFIVRVFGNNEATTDTGIPAKCTSGVTYNYLVVSMLGQGSIAPGKIIGPGADINVNFPTTNPGSLTDFGGSTICFDKIYAVIGMDPAAWFRVVGPALGIPGLGTFTTVTP